MNSRRSARQDKCIYEAAEEQSFMERIEELKEKIPRIYEIKDAVIWTLCKDPQLGNPLSDREHFVYETSPLDPEAPKFWVLYRPDFTNQKVFFLSISLLIESSDDKSKTSL